MAYEHSNSRPRPKLFRALGAGHPPDVIQIHGRTYRHERTIKHDSWAATAVYSGDNHRVVCKFNRTEPILFLPTRWLGRRLARRESAMYQRLSDLPNVATGYDEIYSFGKLLRNATAHDYIEGHPLRWHDRVGDDFFEQLRDTLVEIHRRGIAYVDLNKWENIIVDEDGNPCLIDFQISLKLPRVWPLSTILRILQQCDLYHVSKHGSRIRPDLYTPEKFATLPWWIRAHRKIATPFRAFRRKLLVLFSVRKGNGRPQTEQFVEEGLRITGNSTTPIEQLYQVLGSTRYNEYVAASNKSFVDVAFADLLHRPPTSPQELNLCKHLQNQPRHDQVIGLLKSPVYFINSNRWDDGMVKQKLVEIESRLSTFETSHRAVA